MDHIFMHKERKRNKFLYIFEGNIKMVECVKFYYNKVVIDKRHAR